MSLSLAFVALAACAIPFLALWPVSVARRDVSVSDLWWGPGFLVAIAAAWWVAGAPTGGHATLILGLVAIWTIRLSVVMTRRWLAHDGEDRRYQLIRRSWGEAFWWKSLFIVFTLQPILQWLIALGPLSAILAPAEPLGALAWVGAAVALTGLAVETVADAQLDRFKREAPAEALCRTGLRAFVRHPNYSGEVLFWIGVWLIGSSIAPWWSALSPLLLALLLTRVSGAPLLSETLGASRPEFEEYAATTPAFLPRLNRINRVPAE